MAVLHDFVCKACNVVFEDVSAYNRAMGGVEPVACPHCGAACGIIWLKAPCVAGDENLTNSEKVAAALKLGIPPDGKLRIPQTRSDLKKIRAAVGDFPVGEREILTREKKRGYQRMTPDEKRATIERIRERRAKRRAGEIPRASIDHETAAAMQSAPIAPTRILTKRGA